MTSLPLAQVVVVPVMEGVTTTIVAFVFVCVIWPRLVKNRPQFYAAFVAVLLIILLHSLNVMISSAGFQVFAGAMTGLLQVGAIVLLFTSAGGLTVKELAGDMARAYEVIRRGEAEKEVIIPLSSEMPRPRQPHPPPAEPGASSPEKIDLPPDAGWPTRPSEAPPADRPGIPLDEPEQRP